MTSKNLSFKLMAEDAKRRIWMISLLALSFFFGVIMPMMFLISESVENFASAAEMAVYVQKTARRILNCEDGLVSMILVIASVVCSVSGFSYLYSSKKTDLYHSIPVKRQELFLAQFSNGIPDDRHLFPCSTGVGSSIGIHSRSAFWRRTWAGTEGMVLPYGIFLSAVCNHDRCSDDDRKSGDLPAWRSGI